MEIFKLVISNNGLPEITVDDGNGYYRHVCTFFIGDTFHFAEKIMALLQPEKKSLLKLF